MPEPPILLTDEIVLPPALVRAGLEALPAVIRARGERVRRFYRKHPKPQYPDGLRAGGKAVLWLVRRTSA
jgi:hypothetical protein